MPGEPVDPDLAADEQKPAHAGRRLDWRGQAAIVAVIAVGASLGGSARYLLTMGLPAGSGEFPFATLIANVSGCALIGLLMVFVVDVLAGQEYVRPFLGVGVLGGFTTFSAFAVESDHLLSARRFLEAGAYVLASAVGGLIAVYMGMVLGRLLAGRVPRHRVRWNRESDHVEREDARTWQRKRSRVD